MSYHYTHLIHGSDAKFTSCCYVHLPHEDYECHQSKHLSVEDFVTYEPAHVTCSRYKSSWTVSEYQQLRVVRL